MTYYYGDAASLTMASATVQHNASQMDMAMLRVSHAGSPQNRRAQAEKPSPRILVIFGTSHPDACAVFCENNYYQTPGTLPAELDAQFQNGQIPLNTLSLVSIGPNNTYLVVSGSRAWWNLSGLSRRTQEELNAHLIKISMPTGDFQHGSNGINSCAFGLRGETCLIYDYGASAWWSDEPPLDRDIQKHIKDTIKRNEDFLYAAFGPGGAADIQPTKAQLPNFWSHRDYWPVNDMAKELSTIVGKIPVAKVFCSVTNPAWYYILRSASSGMYVSMEAPADIEAKWHEWVTQYKNAGQHFMLY